MKKKERKNKEVSLINKIDSALEKDKEKSSD